MKKTLKKLCSLVVALTMIFTMTVCVASAADTSFDAYKEYLNSCADALWQDSFNATAKNDIAAMTESNYASAFIYSIMVGDCGCMSYEAWVAAGGVADGSAPVAPEIGEDGTPTGDPPGEPPAGDPPADAPAEPAPAAPQGATIVSVEYGPAYLPSTATEDDTINSTSASTNIVKVTLSDGTVYEAAEGNVYTLVVDGVQYDILDYVEHETVLAGDWALYETSDEYQYSEFAKFMNMAGNTAQYTYRAALTVMDGEIVAAQSIPALTATATVTGTELAGGSITSKGAFFNGVIVGGNTEYTIKGTEFTFIGDGANDFQGEAAAVLSEDNASVTLDGVYINTAGVIRTGAAVKENGKLYIKNSVIFTEESQDTKAEYDALVVPMMKRTPFALGLEGVVRATNVLGSGQGIYSDSIIVSTGWGALSTDSGKGGVEALNVTNVLGGIGDVEVAVEGKEYTATKEVNGVTYGYTMSGSGYVAYADAGVIDIFNNVQFYSPQYVQIMASSTSSAHYTNSKLTSGAVAVMTQQNNGGTIEIKDSTVDVADTLVQIKSGKANIGYTNVVLDNATVTFTEDNAWGGILIELVESDDAGNPGNTTFTIEDLGDTVGIEAASTKGIITDSNATLKNGTYVGDIYNNIYNGFQALNVTLENADLTGTVSSSYGYHVDDNGVRYENGTVLTAANSGDYRVDPESGDFIKIGAQVNVVEAVDANPINLTVGADSTWTVGEVNYLNTLTVANADVLKGEGTVYTSELTVAGEKLADGTYTYGKVTVVVDYNEEMAEWLVGAADTGVLAESQDYAGNAFTIKVVDQNGNNASRFLSTKDTVKMNADGTVSFSVVVLPEFASYVTLKDITSTDDITLHACTQGVYEHGFTVTPSEEPAAGGDMGGMPGMPGGDMGGMPGGGMPGMPGMGAAAASATVTITLEVGKAPAPATFPDVVEGIWFQPVVSVVANANLMTGSDDGNFYPEGELTWAQALTVAVRAYETLNGGIKTVNSTEGAWYMSYAEAGIEYGMIDAVAADPNAVISRADAAVMFAAALPADAPVVNQVPDGHFTDVKADDPAHDAIYALAAAGIVNGSGDGTIFGTGAFQRCHAAAIAARLCGLVDTVKISGLEQPSAPAEGEQPPAMPEGAPPEGAPEGMPEGEGGGNGTASSEDMVASYTVNADGTVSVTLAGMEMDTYDVNGVAALGGQTVTVTPAADGTITVSFTGGGGPYLGVAPYTFTPAA